MNLLHRDMKEIYTAAIDSVNPSKAVASALSLKNDFLSVHTLTKASKIDLSEVDNIYVVGAGKASAPMALALENLLGNRISEGIICVKYDYTETLTKIDTIEAAHPTPDENGIVAARQIVELLTKAGEKDLVISLISGGGSSLLPLPANGITLEDKVKTTDELLSCGASIHEINAVRKHISQIKGGHLARYAYPANVLNLLISDVVGDNPEVIASGPFAADASTFHDAYTVLEKYNILHSVPSSIVNHLKAGMEGLIEETPKTGNQIFSKVSTHILVSNYTALENAKLAAERLGYNAMILSSFLQGDTAGSVDFHTSIVKEILSSGNPMLTPACLLSGGENSVVVHGNGLGGRNTEFALQSARKIDGLDGVCAASVATDGSDGPTDSAGAICDGKTVEKSRSLGLDIDEFSQRNDSYNFFKKTETLIKTGPTNTNVMDIHIFLVRTS